MDILHSISGPLIGAVIGYFTNFVAVKMLFRPHREIRIGGFTLPFTPGIIPKRKNDLAAAVGKAVGNSLLTETDLTGMLLSEDVENSVADICVFQFRKYMEREQELGEGVCAVLGEETYGKGRALLKESLCSKIMQSIREMQPGALIAQEGKKAVQKKLEGSMFAMFLSDKLLDSLAAEIGDYAENYILEKSPAFIEQHVEQELAGLEHKSFGEIREWIPVEEDRIREKIRDIYRVCISRFADSIVRQFHIAEMVEQKIREMEVADLEDLVMSVMKHELGMIVNLGALIGFVLGLVNLLF